jgi:glycosyltransferase involved in cell wall biosynthesis
MKIAQIAPLYESVPPKYYGGTERVVSYVTEELVKLGHDVTLFASGDSVTSAQLRPMCDRALRLQGREIIDPLAHHVRLIELVAQEASEFDMMHFHIDYLHFPLTRRLRIPALTTLHGRLDIPDIYPIFREYPDMHLVSISNAQRLSMQWANWVGTVHHGLPEDLYQGQERHGSYLAFLGRISPEKRVDRAIEVAKRVGMPIKIAAKIDRADSKYFQAKIRKLLDDPLVEFVGEIGQHEKQEFLGNAYALMFLIDWQEPFGLVMTEAMACGTPVIAFGLGSVSEVVEEGTGFIVDSIDEAASAVQRVSSLGRRHIRRVFEKRFTAQRMASEYVNIYRTIKDNDPDLITGQLSSAA